VAFLDAINPQGMVDRLRPLLADRGRATAIAGGVVAATVAAATVFWLWGSGYAVLYAGLSGEEGGQAIAELQKLNIPFRITEGGRVIEVPASEVGRARLQLAARGVGKRDGDEWAVLDNQSLGVSPFVEQVHYLRGIEAGLSHTIGQVDGVVSAKVTLTLPRQTDFLNDQPKPGASVLLRLRSGIVLTGTQVAGIVGLVVASAPGLTADHVTVVDQTGAVLNPDAKGDALPTRQIEITRQIDQRYEALITELLVPVLGRGNFRVTADADIDFSQSKESLVKYGDSHVLSEDETTHARGTDTDQAIGIPGALSNRRPDTPTTTAPTPPAQAQQAAPPAQPGQAQPGQQPGQPGQSAPQAQTPPPPPADTHKMTNYDLDKTVQFLEHPSWKLRGISVAVVVNNPTGSPIPTERLQAISKLTTSAVGVGQNSHVTVVDLPFETEDAVVGNSNVPVWRQPWMEAVGQNALLAVAGLMALFGGVFPLTRRLASAQLAISERTVSQQIAAAQAAAVIAAPEQQRLAQPASPQDVFTIEGETVQALVTHDPARTAQVIRGWIASDRASLKPA
jgi:flagellar M-ring protein FliF